MVKTDYLHHYFLSRGSQLVAVLPPGDLWQCLETFWLSQLEWGEERLC